MKRVLLGSGLTILLALSVSQFESARAQAPQGRPLTIRGKIAAVENGALKVTTSAGDVLVKFADDVRVGALQGRVLETPGHTAGHISYVFPADKLAFVGDTLFSIGCGRVIEGTPEMM